MLGAPDPSLKRKKKMTRAEVEAEQDNVEVCCQLPYGRHASPSWDLTAAGMATTAVMAHGCKTHDVLGQGNGWDSLEQAAPYIQHVRSPPSDLLCPCAGR